MDASVLPELATTGGIAIFVVWFLVRQNQSLQDKMDKMHKYYSEKVDSRDERHREEIKEMQQSMKRECEDRLTRLERAVGKG